MEIPLYGFWVGIKNFFIALCFFCSSGSIEFDQNEMERQREIWKNHRPIEYSYEIESYGFERLRYFIHVKKDKIFNIRKLESNSMEFTPTTIDGIYDEILSFKEEEGVHSIDVNYNSELGYPMQYCIRMHPEEGEAIDGNFCYLITKFSILSNKGE